MAHNIPLANALARIAPNSDVTEDRLFEAWLRLPGDRNLRDLQKLLYATKGLTVGLLQLQRLQKAGQWVEKALAAQLLHDAETNRLAFETIRDRQVRRRAESLDVLGEVYDRTLRAARDMVNGPGFKASVARHGSPKELGALIKALTQMATLYEKVMPSYVASDEAETAALVDGPVNPRQLASQLSRLADRKPVLTLRGDEAKDITPPSVGAIAPPDAPGS